MAGAEGFDLDWIHRLRYDSWIFGFSFGIQCLGYVFCTIVHELHMFSCRGGCRPFSAMDFGHA